MVLPLIHCIIHWFIMVVGSKSKATLAARNSIVPVVEGKSISNLDGLEISFLLSGDSNQLNRDFKVEHEDCGASKYCGRELDFTSIGRFGPIRIQTVLDPCSNHTGIEIKAGKFEVDGGGLDKKLGCCRLQRSSRRRSRDKLPRPFHDEWHQRRR